MKLDFTQEPSKKIQNLIKTGLQKILSIHWKNYDIQIDYFNITKNTVYLNWAENNERSESNHWAIHIEMQYSIQNKKETLETIISLNENDLITSIMHAAAQINERMYKKNLPTLNYRPLDFAAGKTALEKIELHATTT